MNVAVKSKAFRRKPALLPQATASAETLVRYVTAQAHAQLVRGNLEEIASKRWPADKSVRTIVRAVIEPPADLSTVPALAVVGTDFVQSLQPISAAAQVMSAGLLLGFERYARIVLPEFTGLDDLPTPFVGPGQPAGVAEMTSGASQLDPFKIELIVTATKEMILSGNAERLIGDALKRSAAFALDKVLFDAHPGDGTRPPGLRSYNNRLAESAALNNEAAMMLDIGSLVSASESVAAAAPFYFIARSRRIASMRQMMRQTPPNFTLLPSAASQALPESVLLCVVPLAFASAVGLPEVELVEHATLEMDSTPGSPDLAQAQRVRSMFQSDTVGIKLRLPASWALRAPAGANWITCLWPSDVGAGGEGLPDAPFDEFTYGRHQSGWHPVCEEPPASPPNAAYVRSGNGAPGGWRPLDPLIAHLAPIASPQFAGAPTAPPPPPGDASNRIATTQFVHDNAGSGGGPGGGIEEVPETNGAYARVRFGGAPDWMDFNALRVASLDNPTFEGSPRAPTPDQGDASTRLATTDFVARDFLHRNGGQMSGPLIAVGSGGLTNVGLGLGNASTGFYRQSDVVVMALNGVSHMQMMTGMTAFFVPVNFGNQRVQGVGDATVATDALNRQFGDARYVQQAGGQMTGPLITAPGTGPTNPGLGVGDNATGFFRAGAGVTSELDVAMSGDVHMRFFSNRTAQIMYPLSISGWPLSAVGDPVADGDALNRYYADRRYLQLSAGGIVAGPMQLLNPPIVPNDVATKYYVDQNVSPRAPSALIEPVARTAPAGGAWVQWWNGNYQIPRGGDSRIMVCVAINVDHATQSNTAIMGVRCQAFLDPFTERHAFAYKPGPAAYSGGISTQFFLDVTGALIVLNIEIAALEQTAFTTIATGDARSQICIVDLGPR